MKSSGTLRKVRIFRYEPESGGEGRFQDYSLSIEKPELTTILDVLIRIQKEQDPSISFRFACRVNMCGSCGMVINGREGLACKTNVSDLPAGQDITIRPLNHFPVIKDLVVDMGPFFQKYEDTLPFFEPKEKRDEPYRIKPDDPLRMDIGMATDCIACGCCVSSCTMVNHHEGYAGPAALNRAFTLLADERDALFVPRLTRALDSCYNCRTEFNCTEVCPKAISGTRAIKYIQRLALKNLKDVKPLPLHPVEEAAKAKPRPDAREEAACCCHGKEPDASRRSFLMGATGLVGAGVALSLGGILGVSAVQPTLAEQPGQWVAAGLLESFAVGSISTVMLNYTRTRAFHKEKVTAPVLVRRDSEKEFIFFSSSCPHLGCSVSWEASTRRFKCACHGGAFDTDGAVVAGPPPAPLARLPWKIENGEVLVEVV
ncbi:MAG: 2Fe-2S iron-sulfur cluster-binding protein [Desulfovibrionaceae bacterium]|nr:2Fe-2S iron-sulfur cluster-binding protein [Desulfovibrionaceae bacterium]